MNRRQKLVQQRFLNNEEEVIKELKKTYTTALNDINNNIKNLNLEIDSIQGAIDVWEDFGGDEEKAILQSQLQSKIYQKQYQEALHGQIDDVLDKMNTEQFNTVTGYLKTCYDDGYIGTLYDLQGQGVPLIMPIDQEAVVRAVQLDSKISQGLYNRMGEDVAVLKKAIASEVSRGIATGMTYDQVARQISAKMVGTGYKEGGAMASAMRIARTEGHRIQCQAGMDACFKAKDMGADVLKQWDATLDAKTRESHQQVDGEVRELEKPFSNGLMLPGDPSGRAAEVVNCRCALLQRARWALDEDELQTLKDRAEYFGLDKSENFEDFKKNYLKAADDVSSVPEIKNAKVYGTIEDIDAELAQLEQRMANSTDFNEWVEIERKQAELEAMKAKLLKEQKEATKRKIVAEAEDSVKTSGTFKSVSLEGCDAESAQAVANAVDNFHSRYPEVKLEKIGISKENMKGTAITTADSFGKTITTEIVGHESNATTSIVFNRKYVGNSPNTKHLLSESYKSGFTSTGTIEGSITHELGHATCKNYRVNVLDVRKEVMKESGLNPHAPYGGVSKAEYEAIMCVSKYGDTSVDEWFAECFADYMTSDNPKEVSVKAVRVFDRMIATKR